MIYTLKRQSVKNYKTKFVKNNVMDFRFSIPIPSFDFHLSYQDRIMLLGSCFSNNIGEKLIKGKFLTLSNPNGILYNPASINKCVNSILNKQELTEKDLVLHEEIYHSFLHHGDFSGRDKSTVLEEINDQQKKALSFLEKASVVFITLGTAWVYRYVESNEIVANCHKIPNKKFSKELLGVDEIKSALEETMNSIRRINSSVKFVFTVSPIRHLKDGVVENKLSKSTLIVAINEAMKSVDSSYYFPSYEIVMDDLRDYRFYSEDLVHLNDLAINYIWSIFQKSFFSEDTVNLLERIGKLQQACNHRPFDPMSKKHQSFLNKQIEIAEKLKIEFPSLNFEDELVLLERDLNN